MIYAVIGHRGVGKTKFIERVRGYYADRRLQAHTFDLDQEIEKRTGLKIADIFSTAGENHFREVEKGVFHELLSEAAGLGGPVWIALGAGFEGFIPPNVNVWWLRRPTDSTGRIFLNRPALEPGLSPLEEYGKRFVEREARYRGQYHREIMMSEGWDFKNQFEPALLGLRPANLGVSFTLLREHILHPLRLEGLVQNLLQLGVRHIELRDDILDEDSIRRVAAMLAREKVLISFRKPSRSPEFQQWAESYLTDWALELGPSPFTHNFIISLHARGEEESIEDCTEKLLAVKAEQHKLAVETRNFIDLWAGHRFYLEAPDRRSFLPMTSVAGSRSATAAETASSSRWSWYRLVFGHKMPIAFARAGEGSSPDQPTLFEFLRYPRDTKNFAAVLGDPVAHSRTPSEQADFFSKLDCGVVSLPLAVADCNALTFSVLERFGLKAAAVTSPLKNKVLEVCSLLEKTAKELSAVNTLVFTKQGWHGTNTDVFALKTILESLDCSNGVAVWGGGGTRDVLRHLLPAGRFFSARTGQEIWRDTGEVGHSLYAENARPQVVVWALGRSRVEGTVPAPAAWRPDLVFDLNYTEDSPGLEYAKQWGARYISGLAFFKAQAALQRVFWTKAFEALAPVSVEKGDSFAPGEFL